MRDKRARKMLRRLRKKEAEEALKDQWARLRKFKAARSPTPLGHETSSVRGGREVPNRRQADHGCHKAGDQNVQGVGVGVGHSILHQHEENVGSFSNSLCGI